MNDPAIFYGTIDALGFAAGASLCALMGILQWRSPHATGGTKDMIVLWICGGVWTTCSFVTTMLLLGGAAEGSSAVRAVMTIAWWSSCGGPLISMRAANTALGGRLPARRLLYSLGAAAGVAVFAGFLFATLIPDDGFGLLHAAVGSFFTSLSFMVAALAIWLWKRERRPTPRRVKRGGPLGKVILTFWLFWIVLTLFNIFTPPSNDPSYVFAGRISQHWAIPVSILAALSLARTHYADVVLKRSLVLLLSISGSAAIAWQIPGLPRGVPLVIASLSATGLMLSAPFLYRLLSAALDRYLLQRPDYRTLALAYGATARRVGDAPELTVATEAAIRDALGLEARLDPVGADADAVSVALAPGQTVTLSPGVKARALMQAEHSFLETVGAEFARRREALAFEAERRERESREDRLRHAVTEARLKALRAQVDPHFLFNTLNAITDLIATDPEKAEVMTERLAAFFRYTLARQEKGSSTLDEELDFVRQYLDIEKVRFGDRLRVEIRKGKGMGDESVPSLILQPLVENALRHGISSKLEGGEVRVTASRNGAGMMLEVLDDGVGFTAKSKPRVGLSNVRERLQAMHGEAAGMSIEKGPGGRGTSIVLSLPL